ncbi:hypothetical protein BX266_0052 [Streptomyces sp. TLI_171]|nr:hypothetical protein BX266_0052 [Streptomyces sp. TLI_171]
MPRPHTSLDPVPQPPPACDTTAPGPLRAPPASSRPCTAHTRCRGAQHRHPLASGLRVGSASVRCPHEPAGPAPARGCSVRGWWWMCTRPSPCCARRRYRRRGRRRLVGSRLPPTGRGRERGCAGSALCRVPRPAWGPEARRRWSSWRSAGAGPRGQAAGQSPPIGASLAERCPARAAVLHPHDRACVVGPATNLFSPPRVSRWCRLWLAGVVWPWIDEVVGVPGQCGNRTPGRAYLGFVELPPVGALVGAHRYMPEEDEIVLGETLALELLGHHRDRAATHLLGQALHSQLLTDHPTSLVPGSDNGSPVVGRQYATTRTATGPGPGQSSASEAVRGRSEGDDPISPIPSGRVKGRHSAAGGKASGLER